MITTMEKMKCTQQSENRIVGDLSGHYILAGCENIVVKGYEIHQGVTNGNEKNLIGSENLLFVAKENLFATYITWYF